MLMSWNQHSDIYDSACSTVMSCILSLIHVDVYEKIFLKEFVT